MEAAGLKRLDVPEDFIIGRALACNVIDKSTGELVASANDEITEEVLIKLREAGVDSVETIYTNDLDQGPYISQTLRIDETVDQLAAQVAIYRMMRPGEPPTEDAVKTLFNGLFFSPDRYDLSAVGRMKFNRRVGRSELTGASTLSPDDIVAVIPHPGRAAQRQGRNRRHRSPRQSPCAVGGRTGGKQFRAGLVRVERAVRERSVAGGI